MHVACFYLGVLLFYTLRITGKQLFGYYVFPEQELKACMLKTFLMDGILNLNQSTWLIICWDCSQVMEADGKSVLNHLVSKSGRTVPLEFLLQAPTLTCSFDALQIRTCTNKLFPSQVAFCQCFIAGTEIHGSIMYIL